ncbi:MAG TPA: glycerol-3-phosphate dehydrogenase [Bauldia sp.]|nr:glycerol-3-phosphate dehydrogenase [Bauldia sp.]
MIYDLAVIGGGINGCGIARDAAGRGLSVFLCEGGDLGGGSTSASTKLLDGGLHHLDGFALTRLREALKERDLLLAAAPHIVRPMRFVIPQRRGALRRSFVRAGLFLYDHLGGRRHLPPARPVLLGADRLGTTLHAEFRTAVEYSDGIVDDSRLVILNALDARTHGAEIRPRVRCVVAEREGTVWRLAMEAQNGERYAIAARALINASGPWVGDVLNHVVHAHVRPRVRLLKGSHIVVPRLYDHDRAYVLRNADRRLAFAIPYQRDFTLIGSSEEDYHGDPSEAEADSAEIAYLIAAAAEYFRRPIFEDDVVWAFSGVRAVPDDGTPDGRHAIRGHVVDVDSAGSQPPLVTVVGGRITTYRRLAEEVLARLAPYLKTGKPWTAGAPLPGGLFPADGVGDLIRALRAGYPFLAEPHAERLVLTYGTRAQTIVSRARSMADLGRNFGADLTEAEVRYLLMEEWAETADDILWRRTKLGLRLTADQVAALEEWLAEARRAQGIRPPARAGAA